MRIIMYQILHQYLSDHQLVTIGILVTFFITFLLLKHPFSFLPQDQGRDYAVNGQLSKGKIRGVGLPLVLCFVIMAFIFIPVDKEFIVYAILILAMMMSGYLDDAAETPWSDYKKGLIDFVLSAVAVVAFANFNGTTVLIGPMTVEIPKALFIILGIILFWVSINVTNCTDGVDGLCGGLSVVVMVSYTILFHGQMEKYGTLSFLFAAVLLAYLYFNSSPSSMLMGDAGSRALGFYIAILALKSGQPLLYLLLAGVFIVDGGLGLVKVFLLRFLKISILKNTRTPIHDHVRKNRGWSDTQVVIRFIIFQVLLAILAYGFVV